MGNLSDTGDTGNENGSFGSRIEDILTCECRCHRHPSGWRMRHIAPCCESVTESLSQRSLLGIAYSNGTQIKLTGQDPTGLDSAEDVS